MEVLELIKRYNLPYIIAINKIDLPTADYEAVEEELVDLGIDLMTYGGSVPVINISAKTGENVDLLSELIQEETNKMVLKGDLTNQVELEVIESYAKNDSSLKKSCVIVKNGILNVG